MTTLTASVTNNIFASDATTLYSDLEIQAAGVIVGAVTGNDFGADTYYIEQLHPFHIVPGAGRSALLTVKMQY